MANTCKYMVVCTYSSGKKPRECASQDLHPFVRLVWFYSLELVKISNYLSRSTSTYTLKEVLLLSKAMEGISLSQDPTRQANKSSICTIGSRWTLQSERNPTSKHPFGLVRFLGMVVHMSHQAAGFSSKTF